ncbi:mandelate racemase/muconate lactonizing enzyme family protein [Actinopolymorpha sp. B9G3]|uniref:mandelate racemase/muconate lactonizing enzyme family protein n=1 Tax=Actinopolymorpha sp. B9G3 TaxID=3158970 RepID=UPI0032D9A04D
MGSRITNVRLRRLAATQRSTWMFLEVSTDDGLVGTGECSDSMWPEMVPSAVREVLSPLRGIDAIADRDAVTTQLRQACAAVADPRRQFMQRTILGGLEMALVDIAAHASGVPLWQWLGGTRRDRVPVYANLNRSAGQRRPVDLAAKAAQAVADGHRKVKVAPFDGPVLNGLSIVDTGVAIVRAVRDAIGESVDLMVDVHHHLSHDQLENAIPQLDELGIAWLEDAVDVTDPDAMRWLGARTKAPIAGGEALSTHEEIEAALSTGHLRVLLLDPKYTAGPVQLQQLAERVSGVELTYHNPCGPVSTAVSAHLSTIHPDFTLVEYIYGEDVDRSAVTLPPEPAPCDGALELPMRPGVGLQLNLDHPGWY